MRKQNEAFDEIYNVLPYRICMKKPKFLTPLT